jgi:8-oxo-dGTP diphosphatase
MTQQDQLAGHPKKQLAAGVVLLNDNRDILLVKPTYRDGWLLPGGVVESFESPRDAALREIDEELGLAITIDRLLCIDYQKNEAAARENIQFVFYGGILSSQQQRAIRLPQSELAAHRFAPISEAITLFNPHSARRVPYALQALTMNTTIYLENGIPCL